MKKKWSWLTLFLSVLLIGMRAAYRMHRLAEKEKQATMVQQAQQIQPIQDENEKINNQQNKKRISKLLLNAALSGYSLDEESDGTYTLKDAAGNLVLDKIEAYEQTGTPLFIFGKEDGVYAVNTKTNAVYGPYQSASVVKLVKDGETQTQTGLAYRENESLYVLTDNEQVEVQSTAGNFETAQTFTYDFTTGVLTGE